MRHLWPLPTHNKPTSHLLPHQHKPTRQTYTSPCFIRCMPQHNSLCSQLNPIQRSPLLRHCMDGVHSNNRVESRAGNSQCVNSLQSAGCQPLPQAALGPAHMALTWCAPWPQSPVAACLPPQCGAACRAGVTPHRQPRPPLQSRPAAACACAMRAPRPQHKGEAAAWYQTPVDSHSTRLPLTHWLAPCSCPAGGC
jgi:hypothetical protein